MFIQHGIAVMGFTYLIHSIFIFTDKTPKQRELNEALEYIAKCFLLWMIKGFGLFKLLLGKTPSLNTVSYNQRLKPNDASFF